MSAARPITTRAGFFARWRTMGAIGVRMMFFDRLKLLGTLFGVVFAVVLGNFQMGTFLALLFKNRMFVESAHVDVWVTPPGTRQFQGGTPLTDAQLNRARSVPGVAWAEPLLVSTAQLKLPNGGTEPVTLVGARAPRFAGGPWNLVAGKTELLVQPDAVIFEDSEREKLGGLNLGSSRELAGHHVTAVGFTWGLLPFAPSYAFAEYDTARNILNIPSDQTTFVLVGVEEGADVDAVRDDLARRLPELRVITRESFQSSIVSYLLRAQLGISFGTSTLFAVIVGFVIVALSMFSAVVDNIREFGTLKAMGASNFDLSKLLLVQSIAYAVIGSIVGLYLVTGMSEGIRSANLVLVLPWWMYVGTFAFMTVLCVLASGLALLRVRNVEPGMVFR